MAFVAQQRMSLAILAAVGIVSASYIVLRKNNYTPLERELLASPDSEWLLDHTEMITVRGHRLRIVNVPGSRPDRPALLFIHGLGGQASQWEDQLKLFSKEASQILALDLLGCGSSQVVSDWPSYATQSLVQDIQAVLKYYNKDQVVVVGHSYGCSLATFLAASIQPQGLILIAPKAHMDEHQKRGQKILRLIPDWLFNRGRRADRKGGLYSKSVNRFLSEDASDDIRRRQLRWNLMSRTPVYKRFACGASFPSKEVYQAISCRVLMIGGSEDKLVPASDMEIIQGDLRNATRLLIQGAGHMPMITHPQQVNEAVLDFLQ
ncbi:Alpha/Beta hydrolase protein [Fennellomyces sp. T-0311]|nr:Alpha/Beta hydrolase protein [Fennellomyces sp. T-0311]